MAVVTLGSDKEQFSSCPANIVGSCKTENLGLERIIANVVANPAIRFVVVAGKEVEGHRSGNALVCLHRAGVTTEGRIDGATGAVPCIENIDPAAVDRFQRQVELVDMVDIIDASEVARKVQELDGRTAEDFPEDPMEVATRRARAPPVVLARGQKDAWVSRNPAIACDPITGLVFIPQRAHVSPNVHIDAVRGVVSC